MAVARPVLLEQIYFDGLKKVSKAFTSVPIWHPNGRLVSNCRSRVIESYACAQWRYSDVKAVCILDHFRDGEDSDYWINYPCGLRVAVDSPEPVRRRSVEATHVIHTPIL